MVRLLLAGNRCEVKRYPVGFKKLYESRGFNTLTPTMTAGKIRQKDDTLNQRGNKNQSINDEINKAQRYNVERYTNPHDKTYLEFGYYLSMPRYILTRLKGITTTQMYKY